MRRTGEPTILRISMLVAALSLATIVAVTVATPLHSEPEGTGAVEEINFPDPAAPERPIAAAEGFEDPGRPDIRPEPAVSPEIRKLERKIAQQQKAEQQRAQQQAAARQEALRQEAARQEAARQEARQQEAALQQAKRQQEQQQKARQEAQRQEAQRQEAQRQKAQAEAEKAERAAAARRVQSLPAEASEGPQARSAPAKNKTGARRPAPRGGKMALSIGRIGLRNSPIETSDEQRVLDRGLMHLPQTSRPWERGKARNVYVVGHRMGWPGTKSWKIFYRLDELKSGDQLVLTAGGETYRYKVTEKFVVTPWDVWVTEPVKGRDLLTLQTCIGPNFSQRLIIRADRM